MKHYVVKLESVDRVKEFVNIVSKIDGDVDLASGRYIIDAKSIMGIFSLNLSKSIDLNIHGDVDENTENALRSFFV